jgi:hypothetical protein
MLQTVSLKKIGALAISDIEPTEADVPPWRASSQYIVVWKTMSKPEW